jgi:hypothetical protein
MPLIDWQESLGAATPVDPNNFCSLQINLSGRGARPRQPSEPEGKRARKAEAPRPHNAGRAGLVPQRLFDPRAWDDGPRAFSGRVGTGFSQKMRQNQKARSLSASVEAESDLAVLRGLARAR